MLKKIVAQLLLLLRRNMYSLENNVNLKQKKAALSLRARQGAAISHADLGDCFARRLPRNDHACIVPFIDNKVKNFFSIFAAFLLVLFFLAGCGKEVKKVPAPQVDSTAIKDSLARLEEERMRIYYHYYPDSGKISYADLREAFNEEERKIILAVNRIDARNFGRRDSIVVPDTFVTDFLRYSPFPRRLHIADSVKKLILFSYPIQSYAAYEYGKLVKWGPTSLGKRSTLTPTGLYHTNWKAKETISTIDSTWILPWAFNLDNFEGVSMHQYDLPGYPASHACCRLYGSDAEWFYYWAEQWLLTKDQEKIVAFGTPVIIYGKYNFGHKSPWHFLPQSADTTKISEESLSIIVDEYIDKILERQSTRDSVVAERERVKALEEEKKKSGGSSKPLADKKK